MCSPLHCSTPCPEILPRYRITDSCELSNLRLRLSIRLQGSREFCRVDMENLSGAAGDRDRRDVQHRGCALKRKE
jgi:hypothetical protein